MDSERDIDRLLSRGTLGPERARVLEDVLKQLETIRVPWWRRRVAWVPAAVAAAAIVLLIPRLKTPPVGGFTAKGQPSGSPALEVNCLGGTMTACPVGATLVFSVLAPHTPSFLAAYTEPARGGERTWYFSAEEESPALPAPGAPVGRGIRVDAQKGTGGHVVHVFVTRRPLGHAALLVGEGDDVIWHDVVPFEVVAP